MTGSDDNQHDDPPKNSSLAADHVADTLFIDDEKQTAATLDLSRQSTSPRRQASPATRISSRYEIRTLLGRGAMGTVYKVYDETLDEVVALKTLHADKTDDQRAMERFRQEVKLARRITHPNIARIFDIGSTDQFPFLTMEYIDGESLGLHLRRRAPLPLPRVVDLASSICSALEAAHRVNVIHRDLKPDNIMLASDGRVVLTDFGIARLTQGSSLPTAAEGPIGTPAYMAPEQLRDRADIDRRADIYALGVMLFEMLSGQLPWRGPTLIAMAMARLTEPPPALDPALGHPPKVNEIIQRCMARDPEARFPNALAVAEALTQADGRGTAPLGPAAMPTPRPLPSPRSSGAAASTSLRPAPTPSPPRLRIAVLPVRNASDPADDYLAESLTEELVDELSMAADLRVLPRAAAAHFDQPDRDPRDAGRQLHVDVVVNASLRRRGPNLRIRLGLVSVADGFQVWAQRFQGLPDDLFDISEDAAQQIIDALQSSAVGERPSGPSDPAALDLFMRARYEMHHAWHRGVERAVTLFEDGLQLEPNDPRMLAGAAIARARAGVQQAQRRQEHLQRGEIYAQRALTLAPQWPEPHYALAMVLYYAERLAPAVAALNQALTLAPDYHHAHDLLGRILAETGPLDLAARHLERSLELDRHNTNSRHDLVRVLALLGQWERIDEVFAKPQDAASEAMMDWFTHSSRFNLWRPTPRPLGPGLPDGFSRFTSTGLNLLVEAMLEAANTGTLSDALKQQLTDQFHQVSLTGRLRSSLHQFLAELAGFIGDDDDALAHVEASVSHGLLDRMWLEHCPLLDNIRHTPRFEHTLEKVHGRTTTLRDTMD